MHLCSRSAEARHDAHANGRACALAFKRLKLMSSSFDYPSLLVMHSSSRACAGKLMAVGVVDVLPRCLSSVYLFWDSQFAHLAPGKLSALKEIEWVQQAKIGEYHLCIAPQPPSSLSAHRRPPGVCHSCSTTTWASTSTAAPRCL
eukprot:1151673-Pelagomonas_calceolata.AAC.6